MNGTEVTILVVCVADLVLLGIRLFSLHGLASLSGLKGQRIYWGFLALLQIGCAISMFISSPEMRWVIIIWVFVEIIDFIVTQIFYLLAQRKLKKQALS